MYDEQEQEQIPGPEIISTSQAVNLTSTIASFSTLAALFLCFADQRSRAIRRFSVQSVGIGALHLALGLICWLLNVLLGWIPGLGGVITILLTILIVAATVLVYVLRFRMMLHAYRGEAFVLPVIGETLRRFE